MITRHTVETLQAFERRVAEVFNAGEIPHPVHLAGGNEKQLLALFVNHVEEQDWVCGAWRMHYHCLLKGVPEETLLADVRRGRSIALCYPDYRIVSSAIVGGVLPIALGIAWAIKRGSPDSVASRASRGPRVWAFCGDMTARTGIYHECAQYADGHALPVTFVTEDNGRSVCTPTAETWGLRLESIDLDGDGRQLVRQRRYSYDLPWPHAGAGKRVQF